MVAVLVVICQDRIEGIWDRKLVECACQRRGSYYVEARIHSALHPYSSISRYKAGEWSTNSFVVGHDKGYNTARRSLPCLATLQNRRRCTVLVQHVRSGRCVDWPDAEAGRAWNMHMHLRYKAGALKYTMV